MALIGLDWVMLAVPDLDAASAVLEDMLGLPADNGRAQVGWGSTNRVIEFPASYLELMAVTDRDEGSHRPAKQRITQVVDQGGGWALSGLRVDDVLSTWSQLAEAGCRRTPPEGHVSEYADGTLRRWWVAGHGQEHASGQPSFCEYVDSPYRYEETGSPSPTGPLGISDIDRADIAVDDLERMAADCAHVLQDAPRLGYDSGLVARTATWTLPDRRQLRLLTPEGDRSPVAQHLESHSQGLYSVALAVADADTARNHLATRGIETTPTGLGDELLIPTECTLGARISLQTRKRRGQRA